MLKVYTKGRNGKYAAEGLYEEGKFTVLRGSHISASCVKKLNPVALRIRADAETVSEQMELLKDVSFKSASTAASFVTGNISNGMRVWKLENGSTLGNYKKGGIVWQESHLKSSKK